MNRREFCGRTLGALGAMSVLGTGPVLADGTPASDQVRLGIIGPGSRGQQDMRTFLRVPGVKFVGLCDVYEPRFAAARKITGEETPAFHDYRQLLDMKDMDAVVIATPLSLHREQIIAALQSGRHVFGEKTLALTTDDCRQVVEAVGRSKKHYQIGLQYHYAPWLREALSRIREGKLGKITEIHATWHRNNSWRRAVPDPKDKKLERLINWRLYREYSGGLLAELGSHHINFANEAFGGAPESVIGSGGIDYWKDGRETEDNVQVTYRYAGGQTFFFSAITTNRLEGSQLRVYGTGGSAVLTHADGMMYYEPKTSNSAVPEDLVVEHGVTTGASYRAEVPYRGSGTPIEVPQGTAGNSDFLACSAFINSLRNNQRPDADERVAWNEGVAVALGNLAIQQGKRIKFADYPRPAEAAR
jgi:predicted dehydrogenase